MYYVEWGWTGCASGLGGFLGVRWEGGFGGFLWGEQAGRGALLMKGRGKDSGETMSMSEPEMMFFRIVFRAVRSSDRRSNDVELDTWSDIWIGFGKLLN